MLKKATLLIEVFYLNCRNLGIGDGWCLCDRWLRGFFYSKLKFGVSRNELRAQFWIGFEWFTKIYLWYNMSLVYLTAFYQLLDIQILDLNFLFQLWKSSMNLKICTENRIRFEFNHRNILGHFQVKKVLNCPIVIKAKFRIWIVPVEKETFKSIPIGYHSIVKESILKIKHSSLSYIII